MVEPAVWITPSGTGQDGSATALFARDLGGAAKMTVNGLQVWRLPKVEATQYGMPVEVAGAVDALDAAGTDRCHIVGFSAGGTVALAVALAVPERIASIVVIEPAYVGDDDWDPVEADWRARMLALGRLPPAARTAEFRAMLMRPGEEPAPSRRPPLWDWRDELLADMLAVRSGFASSALAAIEQPLLIVTGGRSHPRWRHVAARLLEVVPDAEHLEYADLDHFRPPHRERSDAFRQTLLGFWTRAESVT
jgi:pimeloyl-ACP methyl ester carboxylesterase